MEVRGQFLRVASVFLPCGVWGSDSSCHVGSYLYPLSHYLGLVTLALKFNNMAFFFKDIVSVARCYNRIPDKSKLQEEGFVWVLGLRNAVPSWWEKAWWPGLWSLWW